MTQNPDLAVAALWVAGASAVGALCNMGIAWLTYRRVRPKVDVIVERHLMSPANPKPQHERGYLIWLRLANRGVTPMGVERIDFIPVHGRWWKWKTKQKKDPGGEWFSEPKVIPALGGLKYQTELRPSALMHEGENPRHLLIRARLTNGKHRKTRIKDLSGLVVEIGPEPEPEPSAPRRRWGLLGRLRSRNR
ncbi:MULTISPECIES: hypothetical protein [unclassified Streptomyces]|uniref:hypothetical protein n=1 Tax=unclassified Streptomyces TaxID=2593676 RepID=UPI0023656E9F|nr:MULTISPECIES: hypothetical protein [unclassified Streptomyces]MDF3140946.1 hypothetical protein [Streptomyces sp. T21Q-yed]WDF43603.1 hypothetical protein PBV52_45910 [Streptomyces sp. T12]